MKKVQTTPTQKKVRALKTLPTNIADIDFPITRKGEKVIFGCGAVKVNKADLITVANAIPALKRLEREWQKYSWTGSQRKIIEISPSVLKRIAG